MDKCLSRGNAELQRGNTDVAIQWYRNAAAANPESSWPDFNIANVLRDQGKLPEAIDAYRDSIRKDPHDPDSYRNLADVYIQMGKHREAARELESCVKESKGADPRDCFNLARLYDQLGNELGAYFHYEDFVTVAPVGLEEAVAAASRRMHQIKRGSFGDKDDRRVIFENGRFYLG